ncbi:MAG: hypothetical protein KGI66_03065, partial [Patescibacteria group bacterium]|nr:hypothetical protein [Patescibacteria group bacterium]
MQLNANSPRFLLALLILAGLSLVYTITATVPVNQSTDQTPVLTMVAPRTQVAQVSGSSCTTGDLTCGLVGWWKLDEGSGTTAADSSGNGNTGTLVGGPAWLSGSSVRAGSGALSFSGSGQYVDLGNSAGLNFGAGQDFSYSLWLKAQPGASSFVFSKGCGGTGDVGYALIMSGGVTPAACLSIAGESARFEVTDPHSITDSNWHLVTVVVSRTGSLSLYVDGSLVASATTGAYNADLTDAHHLFIGCYDGGIACYSGPVDDVRIYDRALGPNDVSGIFVAAAYAAPTVPTAPTTPTAPSNSAPSDITSAFYGSGIGADDLNNTTLGTYGGQMADYRFRSTHSGALSRIVWYQMIDVAGYAAGTNGRILVQVETDDGTAAHDPSGTVLASASLVPTSKDSTVSFSPAPQLAAGTLYHVVYSNIDPDPSANYSSVNALYQPAEPSPVQPTVSDIDWAELSRTPTIGWYQRLGMTPILQLDFADGTVAGNAYRYIHAQDIEPISGASMARERFTVSGSDRTVDAVSIRLARQSGNDPLTVRLESGSGALIEQGTIAASRFSSAPGWATYSFTAPHTLAAGQTYDLVVSAPSSSIYDIFTIQKGVGYSSADWSPATDFPDGSAQYDGGSGWSGWPSAGSSPDTESDLQFYFSLGTVVSASSPQTPPSAPLETSTPTPTPAATATPAPVSGGGSTGSSGAANGTPPSVGSGGGGGGGGSIGGGGGAGSIGGGASINSSANSLATNSNAVDSNTTPCTSSSSAIPASALSLTIGTRGPDVTNLQTFL